MATKKQLHIAQNVVKKVKNANSLKTNKQKSVLPGNSKPKKKTKRGPESKKKTADKQPRKMPTGTPFPPGVSGNPKGRPPKLLSHLNAELKAKGYERVSPGQVVEAYELLFNLDEAAIKKIVADVKQPFFLRKIAGAMGTSRGTEMIEKMLNRAHGNTKQIVDTTNTIVLPDLTPEVIKKLNAAFDKDN